MIINLWHFFRYLMDIHRPLI